MEEGFFLKVGGTLMGKRRVSFCSGGFGLLETTLSIYRRGNGCLKKFLLREG